MTNSERRTAFYSLVERWVPAIIADQRDRRNEKTYAEIRELAEKLARSSIESAERLYPDEPEREVAGNACAHEWNRMTPLTDYCPNCRGYRIHQEETPTATQGASEEKPKQTLTLGGEPCRGLATPGFPFSRAETSAPLPTEPKALFIRRDGTTFRYEPEIIGIGIDGVRYNLLAPGVYFEQS